MWAAGWKSRVSWAFLLIYFVPLLMTCPTHTHTHTNTYTHTHRHNIWIFYDYFQSTHTDQSHKQIFWLLFGHASYYFLFSSLCPFHSQTFSSFLFLFVFFSFASFCIFFVCVGFVTVSFHCFLLHFNHLLGALCLNSGNLPRTKV